MYLDPNPLHLSKILKMHNNCSHCGFQYQIEPSFFLWRYVCQLRSERSYWNSNIYNFIHHILTLKAAFIAIIVALVVLFPFVIRWARNIYINMFVSLIRISRNSTVISDFGINLLYQLRNPKEYHFLALYKAFAIEGPSITRGYLIRLVCESRNTQHAFLLMAFGLSLLVELLRNAP
jgi:hypothetical protein